MDAGKPQQQHKKQAGKATPPAVATTDLDLRLEEEDLLKSIDMTLLHRSASSAASTSYAFVQKL